MALGESLCRLLAVSLLIQAGALCAGEPASRAVRLLSTEGTRLPALSSVEANRFGRLPLRFEPNRGQVDERVQYVARGGSYTLFLCADEAVLVSYSSEPADPARRSPGRSTDLLPELRREVVRMQLVGANATAKARGEGASAGRVSYFKGQNPAHWQRNLVTFPSVRFSEVYPGVDLVYYGSDRQLEYDFELEEGADPRQIQLRFHGASKVSVAPGGALVIDTGKAQFRQERPGVYQVTAAGRREVQGAYAVETGGDGSTVRFTLGAYDANRRLTIDPVLTLARQFGGSAFDGVWDMAVDAEGNTYLAGQTPSVDFPVITNLAGNLGGTTNHGEGTYDVFVSKLDSTGTNLLFSAYLGGSADDSAFGMALDADGNVLVTGATISTNFPFTPGALQTNISGKPVDFSDPPFYRNDAFVTKLKGDGSALLSSTYLGFAGDDQGIALATDLQNNVYVTGRSDNSNTLTDAIVFKLMPDLGSLGYVTLINGSKFDAGQSIAVDAEGRVYVAGITASTNLLGLIAGTGKEGFTNAYAGGVYDGFVARLDAAGKIQSCTYLGGDGDDEAFRLAINGAGEAFVTGFTGSTNFPITAGALTSTYAGTNHDVFVTRLNADGQSLIYSARLGGERDDEGWDIALDAANRAHIAGWTTSTNFQPIVASEDDFLQATNGGFYDGIVAVVKPDGSGLDYSTYLGGALRDQLYGIKLDSLGTVSLAGRTSSTNFSSLLPATSTNELVELGNVFIARLATPQLDIKLAGRNVVVKWPRALIDFTVESSGDAAEKTSWLPFDKAPAGDGLWNVLNAPPDDTGRYFRLRQADR